MEHTRFLLLTRSTSVEGCCSRIEREARKIAECTSYTPCVLLSFSAKGVALQVAAVLLKEKEKLKTHMRQPYLSEALYL